MSETREISGRPSSAEARLLLGRGGAHQERAHRWLVAASLPAFGEDIPDRRRSAAKCGMIVAGFPGRASIEDLGKLLQLGRVLRSGVGAFQSGAARDRQGGVATGWRGTGTRS